MTPPIWPVAAASWPSITTSPSPSSSSSWRRSCVRPWPSKERPLQTPPSLAPAIVLVDDEAFVRAVLPRVLDDIAGGYELLAVEDGQAALATIAARSVPLLLTDFH